MDEVPVKRKNSKDLTSNRIRVSEKSMIQLLNWQKEIEEKLCGVVSIKPGDIANIIILNIGEKLPGYVIKKIKNEKLNDIQMAKWMLVKLQEAKKNGDSISLGRLYKMLQGNSLKSNGSNRKAKTNKITDDKRV